MEVLDYSPKSVGCKNSMDESCTATRLAIRMAIATELFVPTGFPEDDITKWMSKPQI